MLLSILVALLGSVSAVTIKVLLAYSSIFGLGWVFSVIFYPILWVRFLAIYTAAIVLFARSAFIAREGKAAAEERIKGAPLRGRATASILGGLRMAGFPPTPGFIIKIKVGLTHLGVVGASWALGGLLLRSVFLLGLYTRAIVYSFMGEGEGGELFPSSAAQRLVFVLVLIFFGAIWLYVSGCNA